MKNSHLKEDFIYEEDHNQYRRRLCSFNKKILKPVTKKKLGSYCKKNSFPMKDDLKEEEENVSNSDNEEITKSEYLESKSDIYYLNHEEEKKRIENNNFKQYYIPRPIPLSCTNSHKENFIFDDKLQQTLQIDYIGFSDQLMPMISPINSSNLLYPQSTKNHFHFDMTGNEQLQKLNFNKIKKQKINFNMNTVPENSVNTYQHYITSSNEINLQNKILINESNLVSIESLSTPNFKISKNEFHQDEKEFFVNSRTFKNEKNNNRSNRPSIDLDLINDDEVGRMFSESVVNSVKTLNNANMQINFNDDDRFNKDYLKDILNENMDNRDKENVCDDMIYIQSQPGNLMMNYTPNSSLARPNLSPSNIKAFFNISPKSAFMKIN